jgi:hypothetical protein
MLACALRPGLPRDLETLPSDVTLYVRENLGGADLGNLTECLRMRPDATLRVTGSAVALLGRLGPSVPRRVVLDARIAPDGAFAFERVDSVGFVGAENIAAWMPRFPNARAVRATLHGKRLDASSVATAQLEMLSLVEGAAYGVAALARSKALTCLELRDIAIDDFEAISSLPDLQTLRLCALERLASLAPLSKLTNLKALWLQRLPFLDSLAVLATLPALESLELSKLWQFDLRHTGVLFDMPALRRVSVDIGGRRKNVEVEKRLGLPAAYAFDAKRFT